MMSEEDTIPETSKTLLWFFLCVYSGIIIVTIVVLIGWFSFDHLITMSLLNGVICLTDPDGRCRVRSMLKTSLHPIATVLGGDFSGCIVSACLLFIVLPIMLGVMGFLMTLCMWWRTLSRLCGNCLQEADTKDNEQDSSCTENNKIQDTAMRFSPPGNELLENIYQKEND